MEEEGSEGRGGLGEELGEGGGAGGGGGEGNQKEDFPMGVGREGNKVLRTVTIPIACGNEVAGPAPTSPLRHSVPHW